MLGKKSKRSKCNNDICPISLIKIANINKKNIVLLSDGQCYNKSHIRRFLIDGINKGKNIEDGTLLSPMRSPITRLDFNRTRLNYNKLLEKVPEAPEEDYVDDQVLDPMTPTFMNAHIIMIATERGLDYDIADPIARDAAYRVQVGDGSEEDIISDATQQIEEATAVAAAAVATAGRGNKTRKNKKIQRTRRRHKRSRRSRK
jgi:hypothetical protein